MRKLILLFFFVSSALWLHAKDFTRYVSPLVGTQSTFELSTGNTYPAIARPWGMNFWTPQTGKMGDGWQYVYTANKIRGFKQTHQPSPWINDYGQFSIMPVVGKPEFDEEKRASWFSHKGEVALPHYYKVYLAEHDVVTEFTPTDRAVLFRFTFPENDHSYIVVDAFDKGSYVKILPEQNRIIGYTTRNSGGVPENFKNYFVIEFDKPFTYKASVADGVLTENKVEQEAGHAGAVIGFKTRKGEVVHARVASSFIGFEQADRNLKELGNDNLETLVQKGQDAWNKIIDRRPDIILSDVMMPVMDGNELCRMCKDNDETTAIPFIMLSARMGDEQRKERLKCGADEYIAKPFDIDMLNLCILNLLKKRKNVSTEYVITEADRKFIDEVNIYIRDHMSNPETSVESLSTHLSISRVQLYKRMISLTGITPSEYLRIKRIKFAEHLLRSGDLNISEIAYKVGFNNPRYFTKYFQEAYGVTPSQYRKNLSESE